MHVRAQHYAPSIGGTRRLLRHLVYWRRPLRLLRALSDNPLVLLSGAEEAIIASAARALRRFAPAEAPAERRAVCRYNSDWCVQSLYMLDVARQPLACAHGGLLDVAH